MAGQESEAALDGVTVLELGEHVAAPFCGKLLALYGATVIKIEPPAGDPARRLGPFPDGQPHHELGALWLYLNTGKQSVVLDLDQEAGRRIARDLAAQADLLVTNYPAGWLADRGLDDATLRGRNPRLVYLARSAFGADGPWSGWQATNLTSYAAGGQMHLTGDPDRPPLKAGGEQADYQLGLNGFSAALVGLWDALESGTGQTIEIAAQEVMASTLEVTLNTYAYTGRDIWPQRRGNVNAATLGIFPCADGALGVHAMPRNFAALAETMAMPELVSDPRFSTPQARLEHDDELRAIVYAWAAEQRKRDVYARAGALRGPVTYVHDLADLFASPQLQGRGFLREIDHPLAGRLVYPGAPFAMPASPVRLERAPLLGEHTGTVLRERLGLSDADLAALMGTSGH